MSQSWALFQAANLPAMVLTLLGEESGREGRRRAAGAGAGARERPAVRRSLQHGRLGCALGDGGELGPEGFTPVRSGTTPARETPRAAAVAQRLLRFFGDGTLALLGATVVVSALIKAAEHKPRGLTSRLLGQQQHQESRTVRTAEKPYG